MLKIKSQIAEKIYEGVLTINKDTDLTAADIASMLEYPPDTTMGDLAFPCFKLSKALRRSPVQIAATVAETLQGSDCPVIGSAEAVNGYLNIKINNDYLCENILPEILEKQENYGAPNIGEGKTVVLDYSSPNVAKPFHIGHLGTTVIGHSIKKLHEFAGYKCIGVNHLGDWGTQFGKLALAYKMWGNKQQIEEGGIDKLVELYVRINNEISGDPEHGIPARDDLADAARAEFHKMEIGDKENYDICKWFVEISLAEYEKTYKQLDITFDSYNGESFYVDKVPAQIEVMKGKGILKVDDGATIVDLSEYDMPPCLLLKNDGSTIYHSRDIAAAAYRKETYDFDKCIYVTSNQQILHFKQLFKVLELMGYEWSEKMVHVPYGTVSLNGARLATRTGNVVLLRDLFALAIEKVKGIMEEKNPDLVGRDDVAEAVGVGAIVFYYLTNNRIKDINFNLEEALSFDGNTGPYVQYTYARACSVLEKAKDEVLTPDFKITCEEEATLLKVMAQYEEKVLTAIRDYEPSVITRFILDLAAAFNKFYHECRIATEADAAVRATRIRLTEATKYVLGSAFSLICLKKTERV